MVKDIKTRNRNNRERGKASEKKVADYLGFYRVPYSGTSSLFGWGDVRDHEEQKQCRYIGECKSITPRSTKEVNYIIQEKWLLGDNSITKKAKDAGDRIPFLTVTKARSPKIYAVIMLTHLRMFMQALEILVGYGLIDDTLNEQEMQERVNALYMEGVKNGKIKSYASVPGDDIKF